MLIRADELYLVIDEYGEASLPRISNPALQKAETE